MELDVQFIELDISSAIGSRDQFLYLGNRARVRSLELQYRIILVFWATEVEFTISSTNNDSYTISPTEVRVMRTREQQSSIMRATNFGSSFHHCARIDSRSPKGAQSRPRSSSQSRARTTTRIRFHQPRSVLCELANS